MKIVEVNYKNTWVAGLCLSPTYVAASLLLTRAGSLVWIVGILLMLIVGDRIYRAFVLFRWSRLTIGQQYWLVFSGQFVFWGLIFSVLGF